MSIVALVLVCAAAAWANPILGALPGMSLYEVGSVDLSSYYTDPYYYDALAFNGSNLLLSATDASSTNEDLYSVSFMRNASGHIVGLGSAINLAALNVEEIGNIVGGGLAFASNGTLLYVTSPLSYLGQYANGGSQTTPLTFNGQNLNLGGIGYVPAGFPGAGQLKLSTIDGSWYDVNLSSTAGSFYQLSSLTQQSSGVPAYSFVYVPAGNRIAEDSMIAADGSNLTLQLYGLDANGNPTGTGVVAVNGNGQTIGYGMARDPKTGDILFTTSDNQIWALSQAVPEPGTGVLTMGAVLLLWGYSRRALTGSMRAARRAGQKAANRPAAISSAETITNE